MLLYNLRFELYLRYHNYSKCAFRLKVLHNYFHIFIICMGNDVKLVDKDLEIPFEFLLL